MLYGGHVLEHAQDEGISLLDVESCYMVGELIHHGLLERTLSHLVSRRSFPSRCFLAICSPRKYNKVLRFVVHVFNESSVQVMLWYLSVVIPNPGMWNCTATLMCECLPGSYPIWHQYNQPLKLYGTPRMARSVV